MTQLFLRFYLSVLAVLFLSWFIYGYVLNLRYKADRARVVTQAHAGGMRLVFDAMDHAPASQRSEILQGIQKEFRCPLELRPLSELSSESRRSLSVPGIPSYIQWNVDIEGVGVALDDRSYLRMGPFPNFEGLAIEDSLRGWMIMAAHEIDQSSNPTLVAIEQLRKRFDFDIALQQEADVPSATLDRIRNGRDVVFYSLEPDRWVASTALEKPGYLLRFGPFPKFNREERPAATATLALVLLPAALAIALLLRPVANQFRQIEAAAKTIAGGDLHARVDEHRIGSARDLARAFNRMASQTETTLRTQRELLQAVSHELKTPLARIRFAMDLAASATEDSQRRKRLDAMDDAIEDLNSLVDELIGYVRMESAEALRERERLHVNEILGSLMDKYQGLYPDVVFRLEPTQEGHEDSIEADRTAFHRALGNLISNAGRFASHRVIVRAANRDCFMTIEVEDDGPGVLAQDRERVFEPFVRLDSSEPSKHRHPGAGVGLGLAIVRRIVEQHSGTVELLSSPNGGCLARTTWPTASPMGQTSLL